MGFVLQEGSRKSAEETFFYKISSRAHNLRVRLISGNKAKKKTRQVKTER
jgi:hypothetical protein